MILGSQGLILSRDFGVADARGLRSEFEFGESSSTFVVLDSGEELGTQENVGVGALAPINMPFGLPPELVLFSRG